MKSWKACPSSPPTAFAADARSIPIWTPICRRISKGCGRTPTARARRCCLPIIRRAASSPGTRRRENCAGSRARSSSRWPCTRPPSKKSASPPARPCWTKRQISTDTALPTIKTNTAAISPRERRWPKAATCPPCASSRGWAWRRASAICVGWGCPPRKTTTPWP